MRGPAFGFFMAASLFAIIGMGWGIKMAATHDHLLSPAHAHLNLIGWVSMAIFGIYYALVPQAVDRRLFGAPYPWAHFVVSFAGVCAITPGIAIAVSGGAEGLAIAGSILTIAGMAMFALGVLLDGRSAGRP